MGLCKTSNVSIFTFINASDLRFCPRSYSSCVYLMTRLKSSNGNWWRHTLELYCLAWLFDPTLKSLLSHSFIVFKFVWLLHLGLSIKKITFEEMAYYDVTTVSHFFTQACITLVVFLQLSQVIAGLPKTTDELAWALEDNNNAEQHSSESSGSEEAMRVKDEPRTYYRFEVTFNRRFPSCISPLFQSES